MKKLLLTTTAAAVAATGFLATTQAHAAIQQGAFVVSPFANYFSFSNKRHLKNSGGYGIELGYATDPNIVVAVNVGSTSPRQDRAPKKTNLIMQYGLNGYYYFGPYATNWQPYVTGGVAIWHLERTFNDAPNTQTNLNLGAGVAFFVTPQISINAGAKYFYTMTDGGRNDFNGNVGISFLFGGHSTPTKNSDVDTKAVK